MLQVDVESIVDKVQMKLNSTTEQWEKDSSQEYMWMIKEMSQCLDE